MQITREFALHLERHTFDGNPRPARQEENMLLSTNFWYGYAAGAVTIVIGIILLVALDII